MKGAPKFRELEPSTEKTSQIYWPSPDGGELFFPTPASFWENHNSHRTKGNFLEVFSTSLISAIQRVWVIDKFFLEDQETSSSVGALEFFCSAVSDSAVSSIHILANSSKPEVLREAENAIIKARNAVRYGRDITKDILVKGHASTRTSDGVRFIHDRFAIVDEELWHFGSTVGGVHPSLNAVSGPWCAKKTRAIDFFEHIWKAYGN